jgi:hypothetical protein
VRLSSTLLSVISNNINATTQAMMERSLWIIPSKLGLNITTSSQAGYVRIHHAMGGVSAVLNKISHVTHSHLVPDLQ